VTPFADETALTAWLPTGTAPPADAGRLLVRASELLDATVRQPFTVGSDGLPTDPRIAQALSDACCAQVEYWLEVGEEHDVLGLFGNTNGGTAAAVTVGHLTMGALPPEVGARAKRILGTTGLLQIESTVGAW